MTVTYDITTDVGKVRLITGDKTIATPIFTDEEITYFLTAEGSVNLASAAVLEAWAANYGASPDSEKIGDYNYTQRIIDNMLKLAARLRQTNASTPAMAWAELNLTDEEEEDTI